MTLEARMRALASADTSLQAFFGAGPFRWFDRALPPNYIQRGTCARVSRVSTVRSYVPETPTRQAVSALAQPRVQIDVLDHDPERARSAAAAIRDWLSTVDFSSNVQFASPA